MLLLVHSVYANADLILTSPPRESPADGLKQYGPLAEELTQLLGVKVTYQHPKGWLYYQRDMRTDRYDIIFDGPHFISWRMHQFDHIPVVKLPGNLAFVVITKKENKDVEKLDDLINTPICTIAPPNLSTLTVLARFDNPVRQPRLVTVKGGVPGVYKAFRAGKCKAAVLRDAFYNKKVPEEDRADIKVVFQSQPVSNQGISVSKRVTPEQRAIIAKALTEPDNKALEPTLKRFGGKAEKMMPATADDYDLHYRLLTGVIFGWEITNPDFVDTDARPQK
jgi:ABC-type phosphate/phosphonate transport system substrate-binding protein